MDTLLIAQRQQRLIWGVATLLIVLLGLAQRDQRGLLTSFDTPPVSAFVALTPQAPGAIGNPGLTGRGVARRGGRPFGRSNLGGDPQFVGATATPSPAAGTGPSVFDAPATGAPATPSALVALADPNGGAGINPGPGVGGNLPTLSPGGPLQTATSGAAPGAVPEAPIWAIMIIGVGGIGSMARRERARGRSLLPYQAV